MPQRTGSSAGAPDNVTLRVQQQSAVMLVRSVMRIDRRKPHA
jgi:hypothetical protein